MSKRPANNPKNNNAAPPRPRFWAKYLTAVALGVTAGWSFPTQAQAPDLMEDLETLLVIPRVENQNVPAPPKPDVVSEQPGSESESLIVVPPPPWQRIKDQPDQGQPILPGLKPEFGTAQGAWRNLDVGQANETPPPLTHGTVTDNQFDHPTQAPTESLRQAPSPDRGQLKNLFGDLFISDTEQIAPNPAKATAPEARDEATASSPPEPEVKEPAGLARIIAPGRPGLKAAAKVDKPLDKPPGKPVDASAASPPRTAKGASAEALPTAPALLSGSPKQNPGARPPQRPLPPSRSVSRPKPHLVLINETGRVETGQEYQRVLEAMNYKVIAVHNRAPQQGATFISYRPGERAQAQELSQRLPGKRMALEAQSGECLPTEITIYIR